MLYGRFLGKHCDLRPEAEILHSPLKTLIFSSLASEDYQRTFLLGQSCIQGHLVQLLVPENYTIFNYYVRIGPISPLSVTFGRHLIIPNGSYQPAKAFPQSGSQPN